MRRRRWTWAAVIGVAGSLAGVPPAGAATFSASQVTAPAAGAELFYDADSGSGSTTVAGTVTPSTTSTSGDLLCYSAPGSAPFTVATGIAVTAGRFSADVSLQAIASRACRLRFVPHGSVPGPTAAASFSGPQVSVSEQFTRSQNGNEYGYYVLSGTLPWSFAFDSLGECAINASYATDTDTLGSYLLFDGAGCLNESSGVAPNQGTRSAVQVDGLNAYPPGAIASLTGVAGFIPLSYSASFDANHDTVTIGETDTLAVCASPGGYPPSTANCPSLTPSGVQVQQTTTLQPGGQIARLTDTFASTDGHAHSLDLLLGQSITAPAANETPAFRFPGQAASAGHGAPDSFDLFGGGPGSIIVIADAAAAPATSNPIGALTYEVPPTAAAFTSAPGARTATFLLHYAESIPASGSVSLSWSYLQAADVAALAPLERAERDRWSHPTLTVRRPRAGLRTRRATLAVSGVAADPVGIASVAVNGIGATITPTGTFTATVALRAGRNLIRAIATNLAGNTTTVTRTVRYTPAPCVVPRLRGRTLAVARRLLAARGCATGRVRSVASRTVARGRIVASVPGAGARRRHGFRVRLTASRGPGRGR